MENTENILEVKNLSVSFHTPDGEIEALRDVSFSLKPGETLAVVGESGCGKSVLCRTIMKLIPKNAYIKTGTIQVNNANITDYSQKEMRQLRGALFSMIFQDPMTSLNPTISVGGQIAEAVRIHNKKLPAEQVRKRVIHLMKLVGIENPEERYRLFPHHFSGGMLQRAAIAVALSSRPRILFADEPTTSLDATIQTQILDLLRQMQKNFGTSTILVTHDLSAAARAADRIAVMYAGKIAEIGTAEEIFYDPRHPYTWALMRSTPSFSDGREELYEIPGMPPVLIRPPEGDSFAPRNEYALTIDHKKAPPMFPVSETHFAATWLLDPRAPKITPPVFHLKNTAGTHLQNPFYGKSENSAEKKSSAVQTTDARRITSPVNSGSNPAETSEMTAAAPLIDIRHITHRFPLSRKTSVAALDDVTLQIRRGEIFGLVGESGSGKTTLARCVMNLLQPTRGEIFYDGTDICDEKQFSAKKKALQSRRQLIFQDSDSSLNPRMKVENIITEPLSIHRIRPVSGSLRGEAELQLKAVGMDPVYLHKYPSELSGGQRQRVAIARALSMNPEFLAADEPVASLDVSIQAQIINLFRRLQRERGFTLLFIAHDLTLVRYLCDRVGVMYRGRLIESAASEELFENPLHPYTKSLLSAVPRPDPLIERKRKLQIYEPQEDIRGGVLKEYSPEHFVLFPCQRESVFERSCNIR